MSSGTQQHFKVMLEQLRTEANLRRTPMTTTLREMVEFITKKQEQDMLVRGFVHKKDNPFAEKSGCSIL